MESWKSNIQCDVEPNKQFKCAIWKQIRETTLKLSDSNENSVKHSGSQNKIQYSILRSTVHAYTKIHQNKEIIWIICIAHTPQITNSFELQYNSTNQLIRISSSSETTHLTKESSLTPISIASYVLVGSSSKFFSPAAEGSSSVFSHIHTRRLE